MMLALLFACTTEMRLTDGTWALWSATVDGQAVDEVPGVVLSVDVEGNEALFTLGSETLARPLFRFRDPADWIEDCPGNFSSQLLEAVDLEPEGGDLVLGDLTVTDPVLVVGCAPVKGEASGVSIRPGPVGDSNACAAGTCLDFEDPFDVASR